MRCTYKEHRRLRKTFALPSMTKQSFKKECDINNIMKQYMKTGLIAHAAQYAGRYEDVASAVELQEVIQIIADAGEAFASLPAEVRKRFENDAGQFLAFVENPENLEEVNAMGLGRSADAPEADLALNTEPTPVAPDPPPAPPVAA